MVSQFATSPAWLGRVSQVKGSGGLLSRGLRYLDPVGVSFRPLWETDAVLRLHPVSGIGLDSRRPLAPVPIPVIVIARVFIVVGILGLIRMMLGRIVVVIRRIVMRVVRGFVRRIIGIGLLRVRVRVGLLVVAGVHMVVLVVERRRQQVLLLVVEDAAHFVYQLVVGGDVEIDERLDHLLAILVLGHLDGDQRVHTHEAQVNPASAHR